MGRLTTEYAGPGAGVAASQLSYDTNGRVLNDWQCTPRTCGTTSYGLSYGYDLLGDLTSAGNGVGVNFGYSYNAEGKLTAMTSNYANGPATMLSNVKYSAFGISSLSLGNGLSESMNYAQRGWLQSETDGGSSATSGTGSVSFSGSEQSAQVLTQSATSGTGSVTVSGSEQAVTLQTYAGSQSSVSITIQGNEASFCDEFGRGSQCLHTTYDIGHVSLTVNGCTTTAGYSRGSTATSVASLLITNFSCGTVTASGGGGSTIIFRSTAYSANTNYAFSSSAVTNDPADFGSASFYPTPASGNMSGGQNPQYTTYYDAGTATITVNGHGDSYAWGNGSNTSTIASGLASAINGDGGAPASASASGATVYLTAKATGAGTNYALSSSTTWDTGHFGGPSYGFTNSGGAFTGGANAVYSTVYDSGTASIVVNGHANSVNWGQSDSPSSIASNLASAIHNDAGAPADASASGATVYLTAKASGTIGDYSLSGSVGHTATGNFPNSSFADSTSDTALTGGNNAVPPVYQYMLGFYPDGDIQYANDSVNGNWLYTYDQFNRLLTSNKNSGQQAFSYGYDRFGNRWSQTVTAGSGPQPSYSFTGGNNRMDGYSYDAAGNLLNDGTHNYVYDAENRIACMDPVTAGTCANGAAATYVYDAEGRRIRGQSNDYLYDLAGHAITLIGISNGVWNVGEVYAGGRHIATYSNSTTVFNHIDWLGTERVRSNTSAGAVETCSSLPFGDGLSCSGTDYSGRHFTGQEHDNESNLEYFGARYYSATEGRFMTADPLHAAAEKLLDPQQWNMYSYAADNPVRLIDDTGKLATDIHGQITIDVLMQSELNFSYRAASEIANYNKSVDWYYNDAQHAYMHSQDGSSKANRAAAKSKTENFVRSSIQGIAAAVLAGDLQNAYRFTGFVLHAVQDEKHDWQPYSKHKGKITDLFNAEGRKQDLSDVNPSNEIITAAEDRTEQTIMRIFAAIESLGAQNGFSEEQISEAEYLYRNGLSANTNDCAGAEACAPEHPSPNRN